MGGPSRASASGQVSLGAVKRITVAADFCRNKLLPTSGTGRKTLFKTCHRGAGRGLTSHTARYLGVHSPQAERGVSESWAGC